jgi:hypothetical protein
MPTTTAATQEPGRLLLAIKEWQRQLLDKRNQA